MAQQCGNPAELGDLNSGWVAIVYYIFPSLPVRLFTMLFWFRSLTIFSLSSLAPALAAAITRLLMETEVKAQLSGQIW